MTRCCGGCFTVCAVEGAGWWRGGNGSLRLDYAALLDVWEEDELRREWLEPNRRDIQDVFRRVRDFTTSGNRRDSP